MKSSLLCVFLFLLVSHPCLSWPSQATSELFEAWCKQYGKSYSSEQEKQYRVSVFEDNLAFVTQHNDMGNSSYTLSLNAFADLTHNEFKASRLGFYPNYLSLVRKVSDQKPSVARDIPSSIDWREKGAVTHVKDQGNCGSCWAFSAIGAIEGINKIVNGSLISLSEQELVDCSRDKINKGCNGGLMENAFQFVIDNHGIDTEEDYPYYGWSFFSSCDDEKLKKHVVTIDGYIYVPEDEEEQLLLAVARQPVSVGLCGSDRAFQLYSRGIFNGPCSTYISHGMLIVGYGSEDRVDYWILKNSWGRQWGDNGYMYMLRDHGNPQGLCGVNRMASYPTKTGPNPPLPPVPTPCDIFTWCAEGETCCCAMSFLGICFSWTCCEFELESTVCGNDHCCPRDDPICDTERNLCLKDNVEWLQASGNLTRKSLESRGIFEKSSQWGSCIEGGLD